MLEATEDKASVVLLILGVIILAGYGVTAAGPVGAVLMLVIVGVYAVISVVAGVAAAFATAWLMKTSFGLLSSAVLRLAGIVVFTAALSVLPFGLLLSLLGYIGLLVWFFELELFEIVVFTLILWAMRFVATFALIAMIGAVAG